MPQTVWNTENVSKWTSNVQLLCSTASTYWNIYQWLTSNPKISIWVHTRAKIHSFFKNARIQTIFEDVKKTYFKFNQITMRPAYNGDELFFEQNKKNLKNLLFLRQKIVTIFAKKWVFQKIIGGPKFCSKINGEFCFGAFCELLQGLEV